MKSTSKIVIPLLIIILGLTGYIIYKKFSFTEEMARGTAKKFFNIMMIKGFKEFEEVYPNLGNGSRVVTSLICRINSVSKRDDGNYDVYAVYEASKFKIYPISIVVNRKGKVVNSRGVSYAYYDKTLEYGKKLGCLTGNEGDVEMERIISEKRLRSKLDMLMKVELNTIYDKIETSGKLSNDGFGYSSGNIVVTNNSPYDFGYGEFKCQVNFYTSRGVITSTEDILITNLNAYSSTSGSVFASVGSSFRYKIVPQIFENDNLKNKIKNHIINSTEYGCY